MILDSRRITHMGINHVVWPMPAIEQQNRLKFEQSLLTSGINVTSGTIQGKQILVRRQPPQPLEIRLIAQSTRPQVGQILIKATPPERPLRQFINEVEAILEAFKQAWPSPNRQILSCDAALECLYQSTSKHAFEELWEKRLHQPPGSLGELGRKVLGGGLRFVMPPQPNDPEPIQVEVKIESYLRDTTQIFIAIQFAWRGPKPPGTDFNPEERLNQVNQYIENQVHAFMMESES